MNIIYVITIISVGFKHSHGAVLAGMQGGENVINAIMLISIACLKQPGWRGSRGEWRLCLLVSDWGVLLLFVRM